MKIRRLEITGFKSFAERTGLRFNDGTTGVVGPNGCGKSNIVDAIRWVMGEQSARRLRGKNMEDVIFNGSETKPATGMAEVRITFENDGRNIPPEYADYAQITVGRRLFRSGESEYFINKTNCRLLDVQELFMGTGVGTRAYSIIGQGRIGLIVSQKPQERRGLIEEAAGISKYNARKRVAERKMEQTRQNLLRVNDVVAEIKRNINSLKRQASKAARFIKIRDQLREVELHIATHRCLELQAMRGYLRGQNTHLVASEAELQAVLARLEAAVEEGRTRLLDEDRRISASQEELISLENLIKLSEKNIEFLTREVESISERGQESAKEIETLRAELGKQESEMERARTQMQDLEENTGAATARLQEKESSSRQQQQLVDQQVAQLDGYRQQQLDLGGTAGELRSKLSTLDVRLVELEGRLGQAEAEGSALKVSLEEGTEKKQIHANLLDRSRQCHLDLNERRASSVQMRAELEAQTKQSEAKFSALRDEISSRRSRLESLQEIERNYEGCLSGVRWVMQHAEENQDSAKVVGLVADILRPPPNYETAVQAVLGERLQSVIVGSQSAGLAAVDYLKQESEGRSSFIPLSLRPTKQEDVSHVNGAGVIGPMCQLIDFEQEFSPVVNYLLGDVVVTEDLPSAMSVWNANGHKATLVTLDGDVLEPQGVLTGGSFEGSGTHLLQNKREIRELTEKIQLLEADFRLVQNQQGQLKAQLASMDSTIENLRQDSHQEEIRIVDQEKDLFMMTDRIEGIKRRLQTLQTEAQDLRAQLEACHQEKDHSRLSLDENIAQQQEIEKELRDHRTEAETQGRKLATLNQELTELKVQAAATMERQESARRDLEHLLRTRKELTERIERLRRDIANGNLKSTEGQGNIKANNEEISSHLARREKLQASLGELRDAYQIMLEHVHEDEARLKELRRDNEQVSAQLADARTRSREIEIELEHLSADTLRQFKVEITDCLSTYHLLPPPSQEHHDHAKKLREDLEHMGDVNPHAVETYKEQLERYEFLTSQSQDLNDSLEKLQKVITKINRTSRKRFKEAFEAINGKFQEVFPTLFNGGKAYLKLEENQDLLHAGVEIIIQPPGKKLQNMELLSGGEKALTAVALLFSIFMIKPTPFCLLDEVDAPLDDANVGRFNSMVAAMAESSQFILITHNKRTMEVVDQLYGITMEEPGVSTVVSVNLKNAEKERAA